MSIFLKILAAFILLAAPILAFQTTAWGINFITDNFWVRFIHPIVASFIFSGIVTGSFKDYWRPWKINREINPTRWVFVVSLFITILFALLME
ncbi:MAG: hypothetical protein M9904_02400 [Chitinophagaceae bacterium]|nr:hypothetical protein [Chitinophagaceae bacterium]